MGLFWLIGLVTKYQEFADFNITDKNIVTLSREIFYLEIKYFQAMLIFIFQKQHRNA